MKLRVAYNSVLYSRERIQEMLRQIELILNIVSKNPDTKLNELSLITDFAKKVIPDPTFALDETFFGSIQSFLTRNAARHPTKPAIVDNSRFLFFLQQINK